MQGSLKSDSLSADEFFIAVVAALKLSGQSAVDINTDLDQAFERIYNAVRDRAKENCIHMPFRIKINPAYGDSTFLRELIDAGSKNNVVDVANPSFKRMRPKLTDDQAGFFLARLPIDRAWFQELVAAQFDIETQRARRENAAS